MFEAGVYPAAVTPMTDEGLVDEPSVARLMAYFEATGCKGVVLAGTNGEGPSLSAYEKRDLLRTAFSFRGKLKLILGVATPSLTEAEWLCSQAAKNGADAVLVMPPSYFRSATEWGVAEWFEKLADNSPCPLLAYNFPKMTGFTMSTEFVERLSQHTNIVGFKDSSGESQNLQNYRVATKGKDLFVGNETLLLNALNAGWTGTISGAANCVPQWLVGVLENRDEVKFSLLLPVLETIRASRQPETNKAVLCELGIIKSASPRLPLLYSDPSKVLAIMKERLGLSPDRKIV